MSKSSKHIQSQLEQLCLEYRRNLPTKIHEIENLWQTIQNSPQVPNNIELCHRITHNLAGSRRTFGLSAVSSAAHALDDELKLLLAKPGTLTAETIAKIDGQLDKLKIVSSQNDEITSIPPSLLNQNTSPLEQNNAILLYIN